MRHEEPDPRVCQEELDPRVRLDVLQKGAQLLESIRRQGPLFQNADVGEALKILLADPERFLRPNRPGLVRCVGRREDGTLCGRDYYSPDITTRRRCLECHQAEELAERDAYACECRFEKMHELYFDKDLEPTAAQLALLAATPAATERLETNEEWEEMCA